MKHIIYCCICLLVAFSGVAQGEDLRPTVMPVAPTAHEFLKYGEYPVSKYTGVPNISIPLYTIEDHGLSIPITLSYHAGGIRVSDEATWVGLGWSLNMGGQITQVVVGKDDEGRDGFQMPSYPYPAPYCTNYSGYLRNSSVIYPYYTSAIFPDHEPDLYKFSLLGTSGTFILDPDTRLPVILSDNTTKVEKIVQGFRIITANGDIGEYRFREDNVIEETTSHSKTITAHDNSGLGYGNTATEANRNSSVTYYLTRITSGISSNNTITFTNRKRTGLDAFPALTQSFNTVTTVAGQRTGGQRGVPNSTISTSVSYAKPEFSYVENISYMGGKAQLRFYVSDRSDYVNSKKLDKIEVVYDGKVIKNINFTYSYFTSANNAAYGYYNAGGLYPTPKTTEELTKRLRLDAVQIDEQPAYRFQYNDTPLPPKTSYATDYWGFYNGQHNNKSFLPNIRRFKEELNDSDFTYIKNNKSASETYAKACILESITYPTGGKTTFDYELHQFASTNVPDIEFDDGDLLIKKNVEQRLASFNPNGNPAEERVQVFYDPLEKLVTGNANVFIQANTDYNNGPVCLSGALSNVWVAIKAFPIALKTTYEANPTQFIQNYLAGAYSSQEIRNVAGARNYASVDLQLNRTGASEAITFEMKPQYLYVLEAKANTSCPDIHVKGNIAYPNLEAPNNAGYGKGSGLRIKSITNTDEDQVQTRKQFTYHGGKAMVPLRYLRYVTRTFTYTNLPSVTVAQKSLSSSSFLPLSPNASGNYVGYDRVTEQDMALAANGVLTPLGRTEEYYTNHVDRSFFNPFHSVTAPAIKQPNTENGNLLKKELFDNSNTLLERQEHEYSVKRDFKRSCYYGMVSAPGNEFFNTAIGQYDIEYLTIYYPINFRQNVTTESKTTQYFNGNSLVKTVNYEYNDRNLVRKTTTSASASAKSVIQESYYPFDTAEGVSNLSYMSALRTQNRIGTPILQKTFTGTTLMATKLTRYDANASFSNGLALPSSVEITKGNSNTEERIRFNKYDNKGNLLQYTMSNDIPVSFIWSYDGNYPVAKIENATLPQVAEALGFSESQLKSFSATGLSSLSSLRTALPNAMVTTYTYDPLIGVQSITDPRGYTTYYSYDSAERLQFIKDQDQNILSEYNYLYKYKN